MGVQRRKPAAAKESVADGSAIVNAPPAQRYPAEPPSFTLGDIRRAIPAHCFERSTLKSSMHLAFDVLVCSVLWFASTFIDKLPVPGWVSYGILWPLYWFWQGAFMTGIWVIAHECGHGAFSPSDAVNDGVGLVFHSLLLVPYYSWAFGAHLDKMQSEPGSYGALGLGELFEMREECLREFGFKDVYRREKERENAAALAALPDLLRELDAEPLPGRLLGLVEGVLAANIFDWGSQACVALYRDGTILDIYRTARLRLSKRPWAMDSFEAFAAKVMASFGGAQGDVPPSPPYRRVMMFVDNSGADVVLGMLPFARELLRLGCEVVLVANSLPAINDITAPELRQLLAAVAEVCPLIRAAREAAIRVEHATNGHVPPYPGLRPVRRSTPNFAALAGPRASPGSTAATGAAASTSPRGEGEHPVACSAPAAAAVPIPPPHAALPSSPSPSPFSATAPPPSDPPSTHPSVQDPTHVTGPGPVGPGPGAEPRPASPPAAPDSPTSSIDSAGSGGSGSSGSSGSCPPTPGARRSARPPAWHAAASDPAVNPRCPKLYVVANGQGSPCLDLRRVPDRLGEACVGVDLLVIEGMGRAIHTNFNARFTCDVLKLAMIKTERVAKKLFNGSIYDCVCIFDQPEQAQHA